MMIVAVAHTEVHFTSNKLDKKRSEANVGHESINKYIGADSGTVELGMNNRYLRSVSNRATGQWIQPGTSNQICGVVR